MLSDELDHSDPKKTGRSKTALVGLAVTGGLAVGLSVITIPFVSPAFRRVCLPYVPATHNQIKNVLKLCSKDGKSNTLVDLGSGDGRIVFAAAKAGYQATGYELNSWLVLYSKICSKLYGLDSIARFERKNLWKADMSSFDNVIIFGVADMMTELSEKLEKEMHDNTRIVACRFPIQRWVAMESIEDGIDSAWLYTKGSIDGKVKES